jgi:hypothetical protein
MLTQAGYAIKKTLTEETIKKHMEEAQKLSTSYIISPPQFITPGEGYGASKGHPVLNTMCLGWYTLQEAQEVLDNILASKFYCDKYNYFIVKLTVIEENI